MLNTTSVLEASWRLVPSLMVELIEKSAATAEEVNKVSKRLKTSDVLDIWHDADTDKIVLNVGDWASVDEVKRWKQALAPLCSELEVVDEVGDWTKTYPSLVKIAFYKSAYSSTMRSLGSHLGFFPGGLGQYIPGAPSPLAATLAGGALGGALGYGGSWLLSQALPRGWDKRRMRRNWSIIGAMLGAAPGGMWALSNAATGKPLNDSSVLNTPADNPLSYARVLEDGTPNPDFNPNLEVLPEVNYKRACDALNVKLPKRIKEAVEFGNTGLGSFNPNPMLDVEHFTDTIWYDPRVASTMSLPMRAAASGLVTGASHLAGGARYISPVDIGRMVMGGASGLLSGIIVGKALGALVSLPDDVQDGLKQTGLWAGVVSNVVPLAFGS